jgi:hypothetical protein
MKHTRKYEYENKMPLSHSKSILTNEDEPDPILDSFHVFIIRPIRIQSPYFQPKKSETGTDPAKPSPKSPKRKKAKS